VGNALRGDRTVVRILAGKWCCGNCKLNESGVCGSSGRGVWDSKPACRLIHSSFEDREHLVRFYPIGFPVPRGC